MDYVEWNNAIVAHFFRPEFTNQPVYLCVTDGLLADLYRRETRRTDATKEAALADFVRAVIEGPAHMIYGGEDPCTQAVRSYTTPWSVVNNESVPLYVGYLALFVVTWTRDLDAVTISDFYGRLDDLLRENGYVGQRVTSPLYANTDFLWDRLSDWARDVRRGRSGTFARYCEGGNNHIGLAKAQALLNSRDISVALPRIFEAAKLPRKQAVTPDAMEAALVRHGEACGLHHRARDLLQHPDRTLADAVVRIAAYQLRVWDGAPPKELAAAAPVRQAAGAWQLHVASGRAELGFRLQHVRLTNSAQQAVEIECRQAGGRRAVVGSTAGDDVFIPAAVLADADLNIGHETQVFLAGDRVAVLPGLPIAHGNPMLFRWPANRRNGWMDALDADGGRVKISGLIVVWPPGPPRPLTFAGRPLPAERAHRLHLSARVARHVDVQFFDVRTTAVAPVAFDDRVLCEVGPQPCLQVVGGDAHTSVTWLDRPDAVVLIGHGATLELVDATPELLTAAWQSDDATLTPDGLRVTLTVPDDRLGTAVTVTVGEVAETFLCLPDAAPINAAAGPLPPGWQWDADVDSSVIARHAAEGMTVGTLTRPDGGRLRLAVACQSAVWWFETKTGRAPVSLMAAKTFDDHSAFAPYWLKAWTPRDGSIALNDTKLRDVFGGALNSIRLPELLRGHFDFTGGIGAEFIDTVLLDGVAIAAVRRLPDRATLAPSAGGCSVFFPGKRVNPADFTLVWLRESHLVGGTLPTQPCDAFALDQLTPVVCPFEPAHGEGVWAALVRTGGRGLPETLRQLIDSDLHVESVAAWREPDRGVSLRQRLGNPDEAGARRAKTMLAFLGSADAAVLGDGAPFAAAIAERDLLDCPADPAFWNEYFARHCAVDDVNGTSPLETSLGRMLQGEFNWCAETGWVAKAFDAVRRNYDKYVAGRKRDLRAICPLIYANEFIQAAYPNDSKLAAGQRDDGMSEYLGFLTDVGGGNRLYIQVPDAPLNSPANVALRNGTAGCGGFSHKGISIAGVNNPSPMAWDKQGKPALKLDGWPTLRRFRVTVGNKRGFAKHIADARVDDDHGRIAPAHLDDLFTAALASATPLLGTLEGEGLALMFKLADDQFRALSQQHPAQRNRQVIYQAAVLSRLHARRSAEWRAWPLDNADAYRTVCHVVAQAWFARSRRDILMKDLVPVEWFLTWFGA